MLHVATYLHIYICRYLSISSVGKEAVSSGECFVGAADGVSLFFPSHHLPFFFFSFFLLSSFLLSSFLLPFSHRDNFLHNRTLSSFNLEFFLLLVCWTMLASFLFSLFAVFMAAVMPRSVSPLLLFPRCFLTDWLVF